MIKLLGETKLSLQQGMMKVNFSRGLLKQMKKAKPFFSFEPERDGYYIVKFTGFDDQGNEIVSQTNVFVCDKQSQDLGYRYGGIQIISEKDTYTIGETARVMLVANKPGTRVLFTSEADEIFDHSFYEIDGSVKLVEFVVQDTFTPNIFLNALSVENYQLKMHNLQLIIPPDEKFLNVKLISEKETYRSTRRRNF